MRLPQVPPTRARSWDWWGRGGLEGGRTERGAPKEVFPLPTTPVYGWGAVRRWGLEGRTELGGCRPRVFCLERAEWE